MARGKKTVVALVCQTAREAAGLEEAFKGFGIGQKAVRGRTDVKVVREGVVLRVHFCSVRQAIEGLNEVLGINCETVHEMYRRSGGYKMVKIGHLKKFVKNKVAKVEGVVSATIEGQEGADSKRPRGKRQQSTWVLHCEGVAPATWSVGANIIPSILFDNKLGDSDKAEEIKNTLKRIVEGVIDRKKRRIAFERSQIRSLFRTAPLYRPVLKKLIQSGVCHLFEDSHSGENITRETVSVKGKGRMRSSSIGSARSKKKRRPRTEQRHNGSDQESEGVRRGLKKGGGHLFRKGGKPAGKGGKPAGKGGKPAGKGGKPAGKGSKSGSSLKRARELIQRRLKIKIVGELDEKPNDERNKFLDHVIRLYHQFNASKTVEGYDELKKYLKPEEMPDITSKGGGKPKAKGPMRSDDDSPDDESSDDGLSDDESSGDEDEENKGKEIRQAFALGFTLGREGVRCTDVNRETMERYFQNGGQIYTKLGLKGVQKYIKALRKKATSRKK
jgi:hypothetical protein